MLKVRANSWHYWIWKLGRESHTKPKNLCLYFWHCVFKIGGALVVAGLALAGIAGIMYVFYSAPVTSMLITLGIALAIGLFIVLGYVVGAKVDRQKAARDAEMAAWLEGTGPYPGTKEKKEPGLIRSFLKARKQKYCPLIEVVDK